MIKSFNCLKEFRMLQNVVEKNLEKLNTINFNELMLRLAVQEVDGRIVNFMTLMFHKETAEILEIADGVMVFENSLNVPIELSKTHLFEDKPKLKLLPSIGEAIPEHLQSTIRASFKAFNDQKNV